AFRGSSNHFPLSELLGVCLAGSCRGAQAHTLDRLASDLKEKGQLFPQTSSKFGGTTMFSSDYEHFFAGIVMPTETKEAYLVDASFVQVFAGLNERKRGVLSSPGKRILSSPLGMRVAQELIDRGFVRLTDEVATVYGQALTGTDRSFHVSDFVTSSP